MGKRKGPVKGVLRYTPAGFAVNTLIGDAGAGAAGDAAMAQQRMAQRIYQENKALLEPAATASIASYERDIKNQERNLARQEQLISQIDPTIIEASQQALRLLKGEESSTLAPLKAQRDRQRQKLLASLREQLGPGAETSTAGIQALNRFDAETSSIYGGAQQQALQGLGGLATQFTATRPDIGREIGLLSGFGQGQFNTRLQQANALSGSQQGLMQTAGAQYTADVLRGQQQAAFGNMLLGGLIQGASGGLGGGAGGK